MEENKTVFECVTKLYHDGNLEVMKHMPQLILVGAQILQHKEVKESKAREYVRGGGGYDSMTDVGDSRKDGTGGRG